MSRAETDSSAPDPRIALAAAGDRAAACSLITSLLPRVRNLVRYLVRGDADVDDMAQLALVEILRSLGGYRGTGSLHAFTDRITTRVALGYARRRRGARNRLAQAAPDLHAVGPRAEQPDDYALRRQAVRWLDELPPEQREVVVLHHVLGFSVPELATELDIPFETARSRLRLGFTKLRAHAGDQRGEP